MTDESGADVSIDSQWRSTIKANSARDPYWQASVRAEVSIHPDLAETIEDSCARCHMPMASRSFVQQGLSAPILDDGLLDPDHELYPFALDGVSCTLCHQIRETGFGLQSSYNGGFDIDLETPAGERTVFGPFAVDEDQAELMKGASGFLPVQSLHLTQSELCATCHTLYTTYLDDTGQTGGEFPEQMTYFEWFYSGFRRGTTCQGCHMPDAQGGVRVATSSPTLRSPFAQHLFVGGNVYMLKLLEAFGEELGVTASEEAFQATRARTVDLLQTETAGISFKEVGITGSYLTADVLVETQAGHKFPTGFPSRRAWIHFQVQDAAGQVVFESGAVNADGSIVGNDNDADPTRYEDHYLAIARPEQVQIYETILRDLGGRVTTRLLHASGYIKDNRLLPQGFEKGAPIEETRVWGSAAEDEDFLGGSDVIRYSVSLGSGQGPFTITAEVLYQSIGFRWADNLRGGDGPEVGRFLSYYDRVPNQPVVVASTTTEVEK
jgi:hypothetical protein